MLKTCSMNAESTFATKWPVTESISSALSSRTIHKRRSERMRQSPQWQWHLDDASSKSEGTGTVFGGLSTMKVIGSEGRQETGLHLNNRAENAHLPFRRRERAMSRVRRMRSLQKFVSVHSSLFSECADQVWARTLLHSTPIQLGFDGLAACSVSG